LQTLIFPELLHNSLLNFSEEKEAGKIYGGMGMGTIFRFSGFGTNPGCRI